jgi:hypothetical protein
MDISGWSKTMIISVEFVGHDLAPSVQAYNSIPGDTTSLIFFMNYF